MRRSQVAAWPTQASSVWPRQSTSSPRFDLVFEEDAHVFDRAQARLDHEEVPEARRLQVGEPDVGDREQHAPTLHLGVVEAVRAHELGAPELEVVHVVRMVHDAHLVGLVVAHVQRGRVGPYGVHGRDGIEARSKAPPRAATREPPRLDRRR
jgi:hypothetical protein